MDLGGEASGRQFFNTQFPYLHCARPDQDRQSSGRLKSNRQFPSLMNARPDHSYQTSGQWYLKCDSCLKETRVRTVDRSSLSWNLERNLKLIEYWEASGRAAETSGRMQARENLLDTVEGPDWETRRPDRWCLVFLASGRERHVVRTDGTVDRWASERDDTSSGRLTGNLKSSIFFRCAESSENALTSGIRVYNIITHTWFCPNTEWGQNTNKLPLWPFWDKITWPVKNTIPVQIKNYSPFLSQRDKG
jgi:hypothetical protein